MAQAENSYVHGTDLKPLLGLTVGALLSQTAEKFPDGVALISCHQGLRWTYRELAERAERLAAGLLRCGFKPGDRVGILSPNNAEWVVTQFATAKAGLILVNINPAYRLPELEYALRSVGCRALLTAPAFKSSNYIDMLRELAPEAGDGSAGELSCARLPDLRMLVSLGDCEYPGFIPFESIESNVTALDVERLRALEGTLQFDDPINIQFTSGTTGTPKAATLTHHNIVNNAYLVGERMAFSERDRLCIPVPMYHCFGMVLGTLCCVAHGAAIVFPSAGFDAHATLEAIAAEKCTALHGVPTMFIAELDDPDFSTFDLTTLRTGIMAGAPCPIELMKRVIGDMHLSEITIAYGMTETGPVSFQTAVDDPLERRVGSVGRVLPHTEVKIVDDEGRLVPRGVSGELLTRGYCVMREYWGDPERTSDTINDAGWLESGDIAVIDDEGYCQIVGRVKDMLIRGGENIFPREIEEFLYQHPKVEQVEVIGVPDPKYGEEVCAWIKLREGVQSTAEEMRAFCKDRIAHYKVPRYIKFVEEFPLTITGKVQKYVMREQMAEELARAERKSA